MNRVKLGIIGVGVQGGFYSNLLTGKAGFPGMQASGVESETIEVGALCDIDPAVEARCVENFPDVPFLYGARLSTGSRFWSRHFRGWSRY